jgi:hypothetical protein
MMTNGLAPIHPGKILREEFMKPRGLCKPWKQGWADKKTVRDIRHAQGAEQ